MAEIGLFLSSEEHGPTSLVMQALQAEEAGIRSVFISDHFHPWLDRQGESPFVWSVVGGIAAATNLKVTTGVTCPTMRIHPAIIAQAAATAHLMLDGRFALGVGSGEALNEHILGHRWPPSETRQQMLEEAVEVIRRLWQGDNVTHHGRYYTVENARIYSRPESSPPILVSSFGPAATTMAARIGDGLVTTRPSTDTIRQYRDEGGRGPVVGAMKVCWDNDESQAIKLAHELWATECLAGQLNQELPTPAHFDQAASLVTEDMVAQAIPCGPDPERHLEAIRAFLDAGFDELYINQIGPDLIGFLSFFENELRGRIEG